PPPPGFRVADAEHLDGAALAAHLELGIALRTGLGDDVAVRVEVGDQHAGVTLDHRDRAVGGDVRDLHRQLHRPARVQRDLALARDLHARAGRGRVRLDQRPHHGRGVVHDAVARSGRVGRAGLLRAAGGERGELVAVDVVAEAEGPDLDVALAGLPQEVVDL